MLFRKSVNIDLGSDESRRRAYLIFIYLSIQKPSREWTFMVLVGEVIHIVLLEYEWCFKKYCSRWFRIKSTIIILIFFIYLLVFRCILVSVRDCLSTERTVFQHAYASLLYCLFSCYIQIICFWKFVNFKTRPKYFKTWYVREGNFGSIF